jgi:hypothetical protein
MNILGKRKKGSNNNLGKWKKGSNQMKIKRVKYLRLWLGANEKNVLRMKREY